MYSLKKLNRNEDIFFNRIHFQRKMWLFGIKLDRIRFMLTLLTIIRYTFEEFPS